MFRTHPIVRFLNQNRRQIRITIIAIAVFLVILRALNGLAEQKVKKQFEETNTYLAEVTDLKKNKKIVEDFLDYCINGEESNAYSLLSSECKEESFITLNIFKTNYVEKYFDFGKTYSIEQISMLDNNRFLIKIFDDILSTGKVNDNSKVVTRQFILTQEENNLKIKKII